MRALEFITGHMIFKLRYNQIYQLKTTNDLLKLWKLTVIVEVSLAFIKFKKKSQGKSFIVQ